MMLATLRSVTLASILSAGAAAQGWRTPEYEDFHNSTYVGEASDVARRALFTADEHLAAGRTAEAAAALLALQRTQEEGLIPFGERLVLPVRRAANLRLLQLPLEVRQALPASTEPAMSLSRGPWVPTELLRQAARHALTAEGEQALFTRAQLSLLQGDFQTAACYLDELLHWPNGFPGQWKSVAAARLQQALAALGHSPDTGPLSHWPQGSVKEAGLDASLDALNFPVADGSRGWPMLGGDASRSRIADHQGLGLEATACVIMPQSDRPEEWSSRYLGSRREDYERVLPTHLPVANQEHLFTLEPDGLHVRSLADGQDAYPPLQYSFDFHLDPRRFRVQVERSAMMLHEDQLFVTLRVADRSGFPEEDRGALFRLDLAAEARVEFGVLPWEDPEHPLHGASFAGAPLWLNDTLIVPAMRRNGAETDCELLQLSATDGRVLQSRFLARAGAVTKFADRGHETDWRLVECSPAAMRNGVVYVCTNLGVVCAVRAMDMSIQWIFRYNRMVPSASGAYGRRSDFYQAAGWPGWPARAPMVMADRMLTSPTDSRYLYSLARWPNELGDLILNDPVERETRIGWLGATADELYFLVNHHSEQSIQATDHSGAELWATPLPLTEQVSGVPAQVGGALYIPTPRSIYRVDLRQRDTIDLRLAPPEAVGVPYPDLVFGDLVATPEGLVSISADFLCSYRLAD